MPPSLSDDELDRLLQGIRASHQLPAGVTFAGEYNDGVVLNVAVDNTLNIAETPDTPFSNELCIRAKQEPSVGRKWELVRPLFLTND